MYLFSSNPSLNHCIMVEKVVTWGGLEFLSRMMPWEWQMHLRKKNSCRGEIPRRQRALWCIALEICQCILWCGRAPLVERCASYWLLLPRMRGGQSQAASAPPHVDAPSGIFTTIAFYKIAPLDIILARFKDPTETHSTSRKYGTEEFKAALK